MKKDPIKKFKIWQERASKKASLNHNNAACLSTINENGFPNGRFVSLKEITGGSFTFCTSFESKKSQEISNNPKVALTFWWDHVELQIRIQGLANVTPQDQALIHWRNRSREAQITSICSRQSKKLNSLEELKNKIQHYKMNFPADYETTKPDNWGCFKIKPIEIEFLTFEKNRIHIRELYQLKNGEWEKLWLQP